MSRKRKKRHAKRPNTTATLNTADLDDDEGWSEYFARKYPEWYSQQNSQVQQTLSWKKCCHDATTPVMIGGHQVYLGARWNITQETAAQMHLILPLNGYLPKARFGQLLPIIDCEMTDRGGVPAGWKEFIEEMARCIRQGYALLAYCTGGHGRTGTFGASLIAVMEPEIDDPIAEIRKRHCHEAVESLAQAKAIFALKGQKLPKKYVKEFAVFVSTATTTATGGSNVVTWKKDDDSTIEGVYKRSFEQMSPPKGFNFAMDKDGKPEFRHPQVDEWFMSYTGNYPISNAQGVFKSNRLILREIEPVSAPSTDDIPF